MCAGISKPSPADAAGTLQANGPGMEQGAAGAPRGAIAPDTGTLGPVVAAAP